MKAAIFQGIGRPLSIEEITIPSIASDEILIEVNYCGICGTDLHCTFECIGMPGLIQECISLASASSKIIIVGVCMDQDAILPLTAMMKELTIQFSLGCRKEDFEIVIDLLKSHRIRAIDMISDIVGFNEFPTVFESLRTPTRQCKVLLNPTLGN